MTAASDNDSTAADLLTPTLDEQRAGGDVRRHHDADRLAGVDRVERNGLGSRRRLRRGCRWLDQWLGVRRLVIVVVGWIVATGGTTPSTPAVPAGWYADPAGRFELRYWDGSAWTEHVSRAGQQYTDPPVA